MKTHTSLIIISFIAAGMASVPMAEEEWLAHARARSVKVVTEAEVTKRDAPFIQK